MKFEPVSLSAEDELRLQAQLLNSVEQAILVVDLTGTIVFWNHYAETLYGWNVNEVLGRNIGDILSSPQLMEATHSNLDQLLREQCWLGEFLVQRRSGLSFTAHFTASLIQSERRTLVNIVGVTTERTEYLRLQEANRLLAEASALLADAVDYEAPLKTLAQLAVPQIADWCAVHLLQSDGSIEQVALSPAEIANLQTAYDWLQYHLLNDDAEGLPAVLRSGRPKLVTDVTPDNWATAAEIKSYMTIPLVVHPQILGAVTFVSAKSGRHFDLTALALAENLASHIAIYLDKARLYHESQQLNSELEKRVDERTLELSSTVAQLIHSEATILTLFRISNKLNATLNMDTILDELAREAISIVNGESGFSGLRTSEGMSVHKYFNLGEIIPFEHTWPVGSGIPGWVLQNKIPYGTSDARNDPIIEHDLAINSAVNSIICTPILNSAGEVLGYFNIRNKMDGDSFTISDQEMLMAISPVASIAIQNALAYQQRLATVAELKESSKQLQALAGNMELAREEERTQIARELHDQLGQALTAMKFDLAWLTDRLVQKDTSLAQKAKVVTDQMDTMIKTVRRIATELRPGMLDDLGLAASIEWQARDFEKRTGIVCDVIITPSDDFPVPQAQSMALFRIFQEALTNVARHAIAQHIEVKLDITPEIASLKIYDDGRGIKENEISGTQSLGLLGMRERAKRLEGSFDIQGISGEGTLLKVIIPLHPGS